MTHFLLFRDVYSRFFSKPAPTDTLLHHLVGFLEGDGGCCKYQKKNKTTVDFSYRITQRSVKILQIIRQTLEIGGSISPNPTVSPKSREYRLTFTRREQVLCFVALLYGNFRFPERQQTYDQWAQLFLDQSLLMMNERLSAKLRKRGDSPQLIPLETLYSAVRPELGLEQQRWYDVLLLVSQAYKSETRCLSIDTDTAWLAGFMEAEGTFRSQFYRRNESQQGYSVGIGIDLRQNNAVPQFSALKARFGGSLRTEGKSTHLRIASAKSVNELKDYFTKYPLRGRKHIAQSRWIRALNLRDEKRVLPPEGTLHYRRMVRVFQSVNRVKS